MYASLAGSLTMVINNVFQEVSFKIPLSSTLKSLALPMIFIFLKFFCVYGIVYYRNKWARIISAVLLILDISLSLKLFAFVFPYFISVLQTTPIILVSILSIILEIIAVYFVFQTPSDTWLGLKSIYNSDVNGTEGNVYWTKLIPRINQISMLLSLVFMIVINPFFLIVDRNNEYNMFAIFGYILLFLLLGIFGAFYMNENSTLSLKFKNSESELDLLFLFFILVRNIVFILNFSIFISHSWYGSIMLIKGAVPYAVAYYFLLRACNKSVVTI